MKINIPAGGFKHSRKLIEKQANEIRQQKEQLEAIIENMSDGLYIVNSEGNILLSNSVAKNQFYQPESVKNVCDIFKSTQFIDINGINILPENLPVSRALRGENVKHAKILIIRPDRKIYVNVHATPVYDVNGDLDMVINCIHDATDFVESRNMMETHKEQLLKVEIEKNEALHKAIEMKDEFLSLISHEFITPISVINSAIQTMEFICKDELSDKVKGFINKIRQNSLRQLRLVNNILDITRMNAGQLKMNMRNHNIAYHTKVIIESVYLYSQQKGINLSFSSTFAKKVIALDEEKYERILLNLLSNAIKFTPKGRRILVALSSRKGFVHIKVKDEGIGIPKDKQAIIFERFGQVDSSLSRRAEGTGIGLSLVKMLVEALDGSIAVRSREGAGSTFTVRLPDEKVRENKIEKDLHELPDSRLIQTAAIEFSDIYLK